MQTNVKKNNLKFKFLFTVILLINVQAIAFPGIMILKDCKNLKDGFLKNEYILDLEKSLLVRNFIYDNKTFKKYKLTDLSIKKENTIEKFIYEEGNLIFTDKVGYPQFYTQLVFEKNNPDIKIKTVINNEEALSKLSTCNEIEIFENES